MASPGHFRTDAQTRVAYGSTLGFLLIAVVVLITFGGSRPWQSLAGGLQGLALLATLQVSGVHRLRLARLAALALVCSMLAAEQTSGEHPVVALAVPVTWVVVVLATIGAILRHLASLARVDLQTVLGLLSIYVLLGLAFAWSFVTVHNLGIPFFANGDQELGSFVYFSYVNLATVGFGDLTPAPGLPRALSVLEAILGQLYLVSVVALAVSRLGQPQGRLEAGPRNPRREPPFPES